jgi:hypothetical protein
VVDDNSATTGTATGDSRVEQFRAEVAAIGLRDPVIAREQQFLRGGAAAMAIGVLWVVVAYFISHSTKNPLQQRDALVGAVFGLTIALVGGVVYLRYSIGRFLRFWLARLSFEQQHHTEAVVEALAAQAPAQAPVAELAPAPAKRATRARSTSLKARAEAKSS